MPTYSYKCKTCGQAFDRFTTISGQDKVVCPECNGRVERIYHGKCLVGVKTGSGSGKGTGCSGSCGGCAGCGH